MSIWKNLFSSRSRIYVDAAAATPLSARAEKELKRLLPLYGNPGALHEEAQSAGKELDAARMRIAKTIGALPDEIIFTASGTEANNLALQGVLRPLLLEHGEVHAITCAIEHQSVLAPLQALEREGLVLTELPVDAEGLVDPKECAALINERTVMVSIQLVNSEVGTIEPIRELAKEICHARKVRGAEGLPLYFHTDASQAPMWVRVAVEKLGVDLMTLDGQKVLGPKGVGCLYVRRGVDIEPILWGGTQEMGLRGGTQNAPLAGSFAVALEDAQHGVEERSVSVAAVRDFLWEEIKRLQPTALKNGPEGERRVANNLNISIPGLSGELAVVSLDAAGISASTRSACNTGDENPSHVIKALGIAPELAKTAVRITLLPETTRADARNIAHALSEIVRRNKVF